MKRLRSQGLAAITSLAVLAVILLGAGCSAAGSPVLVAPRSSNPATIQPGKTADSGIAGCTGVLGTPKAAPGYPKVRSEFLRSQWPDLRVAGTSYVDLAVKLRSARNTDGYETVWFYQRLSIACARHGWKTTTSR